MGTKTSKAAEEEAREAQEAQESLARARAGKRRADISIDDEFNAISSGSELEDVAAARLGKRPGSLKDIGSELDLDALQELADLPVVPSSEGEDVSDREQSRQALAGAIAAFREARDSGSEIEEIPLRDLRPAQLRQSMRVVQERVNWAAAIGNYALQIAKDIVVQGLALGITIGGANFAAKGLVPLVEEASTTVKNGIAGGATAAALAGTVYGLVYPRIAAETELEPSPYRDFCNVYMAALVGVAGVVKWHGGELADTAGDMTRIMTAQLLRALTTTAFEKTNNRNQYESRTVGKTVVASVAIAGLLENAFQLSQQYGAYGGSSSSALAAKLADAVAPLFKSTAIYALGVEAAISAVITTLDTVGSKYLPGQELTTEEQAARRASSHGPHSMLDAMAALKIDVKLQAPLGVKLLDNIANDSVLNAALATVLVLSGSAFKSASESITDDPALQGQIQAALNTLAVSIFMLPPVITVGDQNQPYAEGSLLGATVEKSPEVQGKQQAKRDRQREIDAGGQGE